MDKKAGAEYARSKGVCLNISAGATCARQLRRGKCRLHGSDIYTPTADK